MKRIHCSIDLITDRQRRQRAPAGARIAPTCGAVWHDEMFNPAVDPFCAPMPEEMRFKDPDAPFRPE